MNSKLELQKVGETLNINAPDIKFKNVRILKVDEEDVDYPYYVLLPDGHECWIHYDDLKI